MRLFNQVAIVGTGLIGGSIALGVKRKKLAFKIIGLSRRKKNLSWARKNKVIDIASRNINVLREADLVILATPVSRILSLSAKIAKIIRKDCIVTDVGSTKKQIVFKLSKIFPRYIGSHPLAGSQKRGVINADPGIFNNSLCILTPTRNSDPRALAKIKKLWHALGAKVAILNPDKHDRILAFVSHFPHLAAFALIGMVPAEYLKFSPVSLKEMTRIAASDAQLWKDIVLSNRVNILRAIGLFKNKLIQIKSAIEKNDEHKLTKIFNAAKQKRERLK